MNPVHRRCRDYFCRSSWSPLRFCQSARDLVWKLARQEGWHSSTSVSHVWSQWIFSRPAYGATLAPSYRHTSIRVSRWRGWPHRCTGENQGKDSHTLSNQGPHPQLSLAPWSLTVGVKEAVDIGTSLLVQWLRLYASFAGGMGPTPGPGTKIPHALGHSQKKVYGSENIFLY